MEYEGYSLIVEMITEPSLYYVGMIAGLNYEVFGSTRKEALYLLKEYIDNINQG